MSARQFRPPLSHRLASAAAEREVPEPRREPPWSNAAARDAGERQADLLRAAEGLPNQDIVYDHLARQDPAAPLDPQLLASWGLRQGPLLDRPRAGLQARVYLPLPGAAAASTPRGHELLAMHGAPLRPLLVFGGRSLAGEEVPAGQALAVGSFQFASCQAEIMAALRGARSRVDLVGRGLGGVLAQLAAARFPAAVGRVVSFQSAPVDAQDAEAVERFNRQVPAHQAVRSTHHGRGPLPAEGEGERFTPGEAVEWSPSAEDEASALQGLNLLRGSPVPGLGSQAAPLELGLRRRTVGEAPLGQGPVPLGDALRQELIRQPGEGPPDGSRRDRLRRRAFELAAQPAVSFRQILSLIEGAQGVGADDKAALQAEIRDRLRLGRGSGAPSASEG